MTPEDMTAVGVGVFVGVVVSLASQIIAYLINSRKEKSARDRQKKAILSFLCQEIEAHKAFCEHVIPQMRASFREVRRLYTLDVNAYQEAFLPRFELVPDELLKPVLAHYKAIDTINVLLVEGNLNSKWVDVEYLQLLEKSSGDLIATLKKHI